MFEPWEAGDGCKARPIRVERIADDLRNFRKAEQRRLAIDDPALSVSAAPIRASALPKGRQVQHTMWGCSASKVACRHTLPRSKAAALDIIVQNMNRWVCSLGAAVVKRAESLVCFRGVHPTTGERRDAIALLVFSRHQPQIHFYAMCKIKDAPLAGAAPEVMPEVPFVASIKVVPSRMSTLWASVCIKTNEELALEMAATHMDWSIVPLQWRLQEGAAPLLDHVVEKIGDAFDPKAKPPRALAQEATNFIDQLMVGSDPVAAGIRAARVAMASGASPGRRGAAPIDSIAAGGEAEVEAVEAELFADMPFDVLDDVHRELCGDPLPLDDLGAAPTDDDWLLDEDDSSEEAGVAPGPDWEAIDRAIAHCHVDRKTGVVTCSLPPWNAYTKIGRITRWGPRKQKDKQKWSISCCCHMHTNCKTKARLVRHCSRDTLLKWLFTGKIVYPCEHWSERKWWGEAHAPGFLAIHHFEPPPSPPGEDFLSSDGDGE